MIITLRNVRRDVLVVLYIILLNGIFAQFAERRAMITPEKNDRRNVFVVDIIRLTIIHVLPVEGRVTTTPKMHVHLIHRRYLFVNINPYQKGLLSTYCRKFL